MSPNCRDPAATASRLQLSVEPCAGHREHRVCHVSFDLYSWQLGTLQFAHCLDHPPATVAVAQRNQPGNAGVMVSLVPCKAHSGTS